MWLWLNIRGLAVADVRAMTDDEVHDKVRAVQLAARMQGKAIEVPLVHNYTSKLVDFDPQERARQRGAAK
jgi:hypothetical protein